MTKLSERAWEVNTRLAESCRPRSGAVAIGGSDQVTYELRADAAREFGSVFAKTGSADAARDAARATARLWVKNWNERGSRGAVAAYRGSNHLWEGTADTMIDDLWRDALNGGTSR